MPKRREYRAQGIVGSFWRSERGAMEERAERRSGEEGG